MNWDLKRSRTVGWLGAGILAACLGGVSAMAQAPAQQQNPPAKPPADANPFPEDTSNVPVVPTSPASPATVPGTGSNAPAEVHLPANDDDPVRSPDEPIGYDSGSSSSDGFSSSSAGLDRISPPPDDEETRTRKRGRKQAAEPEEHKETAKEDESVGSYYLGQKNWRAALSRYQSALVLDPENPDVYWGLAEAQRHLGDLANAKANYKKVMEYDPDSKHAKESKKILNDPEMAKASGLPAN